MVVDAYMFIVVGSGQLFVFLEAYLKLAWPVLNSQHDYHDGPLSQTFAVHPCQHDQPVSWSGPLDFVALDMFPPCHCVCALICTLSVVRAMFGFGNAVDNPNGH